MSGQIPDPPLDENGMVRVGAHLIAMTTHRGIYGLCVMCPDGGYDWWDLTECDLPPVVDRTGTSTDQVLLHPRCVPALLAHWGMILNPADPDVGDLQEAPDSAPDVGVPTSNRQRPGRARTGAYARRGGT